ncbi:MAG: TerC family protein [Phycisphaerae bacterium]|nr:TerC family protein [Phycisphaerae bacterium]
MIAPVELTTPATGAPLQVPLWVWGAFIGGVALAIIADLKIMHRSAHEIAMREALRMVAFWVSLGMLVGAGIWVTLGADAGAQYLAGYLVELSLSIDNVFVFAVIFDRFKVSRERQPRVLFWGILGAVLMRGACIAGGLALLSYFTWTMFIFGAMLLLTSVKMLRSGNDDPDVDPSRSRALRLMRRIIPISDAYDGHRFFTRQAGRCMATPLLAVLLIVEISDLVFAVDSIPAVFGITQDPFLVFSSNIMAIIGLRALYFAVASLLGEYRFLKPGLAILIAAVGVKLILQPMGFHVPPLATLTVIGAILGCSIGLSLLFPKRATNEPGSAMRSAKPD